MASETQQRNVTKVLRILRSATHTTSGRDDDAGQYAIGAAPYDAAIRILTSMDARTGKLDPKLRGKKRPAPKAAKK